MTPGKEDYYVLSALGQTIREIEMARHSSQTPGAHEEVGEIVASITSPPKRC